MVNTMPKPTIIDLFSGCGGFALGAELAGFHSKIAIDIEASLQSSYKLNFPETNAILSDISQMDSTAWRFLLSNEEVDGVIGGPPCQGYSRMGKNNHADPRRTLIFHFFRMVNIIKPKFFVMENVEGLVDSGNIETLHSAMNSIDNRYTVLDPIIVDASEFGAATKRKRVLVIGFDSERMNPLTSSAFFETRYAKVNVKQAISDVGQLVHSTNNNTDYGWSKYEKGKPSNYAKSMRTTPPFGLGSDIARKMLAEGYFSGSYDTKHSQNVSKRFQETLPGCVEKVSRYPKLEWEGLCPTLRAGTGNDRGNFQAMRPIHPTEPRVITVREAARLQGFPDWFLFHPTKHQSFRMIGNSVSPILSQRIMELILSRIEEHSTGRVATSQ